MKRFTQLSLTLSLLLFTAVLLSGCSEYWWTRGQPPSVATLLDRSQSRLAAARESNADARSEVSHVSEELQGSLLAALASVKDSSDEGESQALLENLSKAGDGLIALEGKVSVGSRAALGELSGQMRAFADQASKGEKPEYPAFGLFTARTFFFLANELEVPAPTFG